MANYAQGSTGSAVKNIQKMLNATGIAGKKLEVDGIFGKKTKAGVMAFQKNYQLKKLKVDGIVGKQTMPALQSYPQMKGLQKKVADAQKKIAIWTKELATTAKLLAIIEKQKKKKKPVEKEISDLKKRVKQLRSIRESAYDSFGFNAYENAGLEMAAQRFRKLADATEEQQKNLEAIHNENQSDFDRRISLETKRMSAIKKIIADLEKAVTAFQKQLATM